MQKMRITIILILAATTFFLRALQAADLAQPGDTVTVHSGVYRERINPPRGVESDTRRIVYQAAPGNTAIIDRQALVMRHAVERDHVDTDPRSALQVGNGDFAFNADVTGLQTFHGQTLSNWGWHEEPLPEGMKPDDRKRTSFVTRGRERHYLAPHDQAALAQWLNDNPHKAGLGRLRFVTGDDGDIGLKPEDITKVRQKLDLWRGKLISDFEFKGKPVHVETVCHPNQDVVAISIQSPLLAEGGLSVVLDFPYPGPKGDHWDLPERHATRITQQQRQRADLVRTVDAMSYHVAISWSDGRFSDSQKVSGQHHFRLDADGAQALTFTCAFAPKPLPASLPSVADITASAEAMWKSYWSSGGVIDLSGSKDVRWKELERRVVVSQYLMRVNSAGSMPPAEIGLHGIDVWCSKFHLEMTAWHGAHFMLWGRPECVKGWIRWFNDIGLPSARLEAQAEGWKGAKWLKTPDPFGRWESWDHGPNRVTQNAHPFFWAELSYRQQPTRETLETWKEIVFETATMMADFMVWDETTNRYIMGPPVMSGAEHNSGFDCWNSTSELNYWAMSLDIAQKWRERLNMQREPAWDRILANLSRPPVVDGVYIDVESHPRVWNQNGSNWLRPAWFEVYGCIRGPMIEPAIMEKTYERASGELRSGEWKGNLWGCDYPMMAMTAARLGKPDEAVDWLLNKSGKNSYPANGFCEGWYLPGNGALLWAVAMMAAGWDGAPARHAPGFPADGSWVVKWEGLKIAL